MGFFYCKVCNIQCTNFEELTTHLFKNHNLTLENLYSQYFSNSSCFPQGHYYSTIISIDDVKKRQEQIWCGENTDEINGINLNTNEQINLVKEFENYYNQIPFIDEKNNQNRFYFNNSYYTYTDAIFLYSMIRHYKPKKIIEIGSGYSSAVMMDTDEKFLNQTINFTFIEPFPDRLKTLFKNTDYNSKTIIEKNVQEVELEIFESLNCGDFLFIDSSHVVKTGGDLNYILFEILPKLKKGVLIHFHDIFYPFEYPKEWVFMGRNWNEDYFLRAFLMYNNDFKIMLFSHYLHKHHKYVFDKMPLCNKNAGGNLWIEKTF